MEFPRFVWLILIAVLLLGIGTAIGNSMATSKYKKLIGTKILR